MAYSKPVGANNTEWTSQPAARTKAIRDRMFAPVDASGPYKSMIKR